MTQQVKNADWQNRIVGHADVDPTTLLANPENWRRHEEVQARHLRTVLNRIGFVRTIKVSQNSGLIVDGHLRVKEAIDAGATKVPVTYLDLNPDEERLVLASFDAIGEMAFVENDILAETKALLAESGLEIQSLLAEMGAEVEMPAADAGKKAHQKKYEPSALRLTVGEFQVIIPYDDYERWREGMYQEIGLTPKDITAEMLRRLGIEH